MTIPPWTADIEVNATLAERVIAGQFRQFGGEPVRPLGIGWDNAAFRVGEGALFRFPRRRSAVALIEREIAILPRVAPLLPLRISAPRYIGVATADYPWIFAGYDLIAGTTACSAALTDESRAGLARPLGSFLQAVHRIDPAPLIARGLPGDEIGRLDHEKRLSLTRERVLPLAAVGLVGEPELFVSWLAAHPPVALDDGRRTLVHGDMYARHVLLDEEARPTGIIDWGDVHLGDPALDIAIAHMMLPPSAHAAFREAYGGIDERTWTVARYRAIYHAVLELDYGVRANDQGMRASGLDTLRLVRTSIAAT
jgi:aminoglycoside phosphotransferase (APT) family kinase protein